MTFSNINHSQVRYTIGAFIFGIVIIIFAIQRLIVMWTPQSSLTALKGTLRSCDTYVTTVTSTSCFGYTHDSQKAELLFYLNEFPKKFSLVENIGDDFNSSAYENIKAGLRHADSVTVWVQKSELEGLEPKVFQIDTDKITLLDFDTVRFKDRSLTAYLLLLGLGCIFLPVYLFIISPAEKNQLQ